MTMNQRMVAAGDEVYTRDDDKLGTVKEIRDGYLKIDASMQTDYWLPESLVISKKQNRVIMGFEKSKLGLHKAKAPADQAQARPAGEVTMAGRTGPETQSDLLRPDDRDLPHPSR